MILRIGFTDEHQNTRKQFLLHRYADAVFVRAYEMSKVRLALKRRLRLLSKADSVHQYFRGRIVYPRVALMHYWNAVGATSIPWVVTTSIGVPFGIERESPMYAKALERIADESCRRIICTSDFALSKQLRKIEKLGELAPAVRRKVVLLPPPQPAVTPPSVKDYFASPLEFIFIGKDFVRKGGRETINAFRRLVDGGCEARLHLITDPEQLNRQDSDPYLARSVRAIRECDSIKFLGLVSHGEVMQVLGKAHVALLPSYQETYGYSVLEAQGSGCPVITTDVGAFAEINADGLGWRVSTEVVDQDQLPTGGAAGVERAIMLEEQLFSVMSHLSNAREQVATTAERAYQNIVTKHDPERHKSTLHRIYAEAVEETT